MLFSTESLAGAATAAQRANKLGDQPFALIHLPAPPPATICQGLFSVNFLEYSLFGKTNRFTQVRSLHYAIRAMGATSLRISELCLPFSPHPNNSDGNVNLVHHFSNTNRDLLDFGGVLKLARMPKEFFQEASLIPTFIQTF